MAEATRKRVFPIRFVIGAGLVGLLFLLRAVIPPDIYPTDFQWADDETAEAAAPFDPWNGYKHEKECAGNAIQHIWCRHANGTKTIGSKFHTADKQEIIRLVNEALAKGTRSWNSKKECWEVVHKFTDTIGKVNGKGVQWIKVQLTKEGLIRSAFPFAG